MQGQPSRSATNAPTVLFPAPGSPTRTIDRGAPGEAPARESAPAFVDTREIGGEVPLQFAE